MAVHVRHRLVHERCPAELALVPYRTVGGLVEDVADGGVAERDRLAVLVGEVVGGEKLACLHVVGIQLSAEERLVEVPYLCAVRLVGQAPQPEHQLLQLQIDLALVLVAKLSADQGGVATLPVLVHLLAEAQRALGQRVVIHVLQYLHHARHHVPVILLAHQLAIGRSPVVELDAAVEHRCVHHVLLYLLGGEVEVRLPGVAEEGDGSLVHLIVGGHPTLQPYLRTAGELFLHLVEVLGG